MPIFLSERNTRIREQMDDPDCSKKALYKTYRQFSIVNTIVSGWKRIYQAHIRPLIEKQSEPLFLLDIGSGGGDIPIKLAKWAKTDGLDLQITAIDTDQRAIDYVEQLSVPANITFLKCSSTVLLHQDRHFDVVISNHLLHHLSCRELHQLLQEAENLSTKLVLFNDIERSDFAYGLFDLFSRPLSPGSFITQDGLSSIKRSYTRNELQKSVPDGWYVEPMFPFRLLLSYSHRS